MIVVKQFNSEKEIHEWQSNKENLAELKKQYPPKEYNARIDLIQKQLIVTIKTNAK